MRLSGGRGSPFRAALRVIALIVAALSAAGGAAAQQPVPGIDHEVLGLDVSLREEAYPLDAPTFAELVRALNGLSVEGAGAPLSQGLTEYRILPEWSVAAASGVCRVAEARVRVTVVVTLPIWTAVAAASDDERVRWESIRDRIRAHEHAHRDMTLEAAASLLDTIGGLSARGCAQLRRAVEAEIALADARLSERHAEVDASGGR